MAFWLVAVGDDLVLPEAVKVPVARVDGSAVVESLLAAADAPAARTAIGAGTSNLSVGGGAGNAKAGNWTPGLADLPGGAVVWTASTTRPTARTDVMVIFTGGTDPGSNALEGDLWLGA